MNVGYAFGLALHTESAVNADALGFGIYAPAENSFLHGLRFLARQLSAVLQKRAKRIGRTEATPQPKI